MRREMREGASTALFALLCSGLERDCTTMRTAELDHTGVCTIMRNDGIRMRRPNTARGDTWERCEGEASLSSESAKPTHSPALALAVHDELTRRDHAHTAKEQFGSVHARITQRMREQDAKTRAARFGELPSIARSP